MLASFSPFFEAMFTNDMLESKQKLIELNEIDTQATTDIIRSMYGQKLEVTIENASLVAVTASRLLNMPIVDECCTILSSNIDVDNFVEMYLFAETYQFQQIIDASYQFMISNFKVCTTNSDFHQIPSSMLIRCLQSNDLNVANEVDLLYILEKWYNDHKPQCDDNTLVEIFENIRLAIIPINNLIEFEQDTKLFEISTGCFDRLNKIKAFLATPERHFSKLCHLNYRNETGNFQKIVKTTAKETFISNKEMVQIEVNGKILNNKGSFMNVEAINRIDYGAITIGHKLFLMGGTTEGTYGKY